MGNKKKKKVRSPKKKKQTELQTLSLEQLLEKGATLLHEGKPRGAIPLFKAAAKTTPGDDTARDLLFQAYRLRAGQMQSA
ncbi:MAG: hypothetical protein V2B19_19055 [Pseudomonadota bacterium]